MIDEPQELTVEGEQQSQNEYAGFAADDDSVANSASDIGTDDDDDAIPNSADDEAVEGSGATAEDQPAPHKETPAAQQVAPDATASHGSESGRYTENDYQGALLKVDKDLDDLAEQYEASEIDFKAFQTKSRALHDQRAALKSTLFAIQADNERRQAEWGAAVAEFGKDPKNAPFNGALSPLLLEQVRIAFSQPMPSGKSYLNVLQDAAENVLEQMRTMLGIKDMRLQDELVQKNARLKAAAVTPARSTRTPTISNPWEGFAATD